MKAQVKISSAESSDPLSELHKMQCVEANGDIDRDGIADMAVIAFPRDMNLIEINEDGDTIDYNRPILAILKGRSDGTFAKWKEYKEIFPNNENPFEYIDYVISINDKGVLRIDMQHFYAAGSWVNNNDSYVFRLQNGDFYLIGMDTDNYSRNSGEGEKISYNYLTHKKQVTTYNVFDESVKPRVKWSKIPSEPLRKLGTWVIGE